MTVKDGTHRAVDDALASVLALAGTPRPGARKGRRSRWRRTLRWIVAPLTFAVLPFLVLLRGSVLAYAESGLPVWLCILAAAVCSGLVVFAGTAWLVRRLGGSLPRYGLRLAVLLVAAYSVFGLVYVSADNVKRPEIRDTYSALHPLLRLSVSTLVLLDSDQIITDTERGTEDYGRMGLEVNPSSLHYRQTDGYVHAIDLRTLGRSEAGIALTRWYFRCLGFAVLRHAGTADHLHVSLAPRAR